MEFTEKLKKHLKEFGWSKDRNDSSQIELAKNYPEFVREFLRNIGGLEIKKYKWKGVELRDVNRVIFGVSHSEGTDGISAGYSEFLGRPLYPIGVYLPETHDISVDDNGCVYLLGEYCYCAGKDFYKGIENLIRGNERNMLELDPENDDEAIWLELTDNGSQPVDFDSYEFRYDF